MNQQAFIPESSQVRSMFASIAERYDVTNSVLSMGMHHLWKRSFIRWIDVKPGARVLDLACGTGDLVPLLQARFGGEVIGGDFCEPMLEVARRRFGDRFKFEKSDALNLHFSDASFDLVTVSFGVRNFEDLQRGLSEVYRVLKPGGKIAVLEFGQPQGAVLSMLYRFYSKQLMPLIGGLLTGNRGAYAYLPETAARFPSGARFIECLEKAGFSQARTRLYTGGIAFGYQASRPQ